MSLLYLPNGQSVTVSKVFGGFSFKPNDLNVHHTVFPPGWTAVLHTDNVDTKETEAQKVTIDNGRNAGPPRGSSHAYSKPTMHNDALFISSISIPNSNDFKPATSPSRQMAMMLWTTLYWYFQQPEPDTRMTTTRSQKTADAGKPRGEWRVNVRREGVFRSKNILPKLERMGLIASDDSTVGLLGNDRSGEGWNYMFASRRSFWQLDPRLFLFTLSPTSPSPFMSGSPYPSRPGSPVGSGTATPKHESVHEASSVMGPPSPALMLPTPGPYSSTSHLPTYYPPPPLLFTTTGGIRHPIRPKPPRQGEIFYNRYIPSFGQYLSFRIPTLSPKPPPLHSNSASPLQATFPPSISGNDAGLPSMASLALSSSDVDYLHKWMNNPRVSYSWGEDGPRSYQENFLQKGLQSRHSFPVIGCWDNKPFGYFEIYWVREDGLGRHLDNQGDLWDRGIHCLVGEDEYRGPDRVQAWLSSLVHYCFLADMRTQNIMLEPRIDNERFISHLQTAGFYKEKEVTFPHKQSALMKIRREAWEAPTI